MDLNFFKTTRVLDGGMGQELLARGVKPNGTLWSANALLNEEYHELLADTHRDFIKAGAEIIVTTTFTTRRKRLKDNNVEEKQTIESSEEKHSIIVDELEENKKLQDLLSAVVGEFGADAGGHDNAAGALIKTSDKEAFLTSLKKALEN